MPGLRAAWGIQQAVAGRSPPRPVVCGPNGHEVELLLRDSTGDRRQPVNKGADTMSHTDVVYPMPAGGLTRGHDSPWQVRERDEGSEAAAETGPEDLLALTDTIQRKLRTAEALAWILHGSGHHPSGAEKVTAGVIAELIHEAAQVYDKLWEEVRESRN